MGTFQHWNFHVMSKHGSLFSFFDHSFKDMIIEQQKDCPICPPYHYHANLSLNVNQGKESNKKMKKKWFQSSTLIGHIYKQKTTFYVTLNN